MNRKEFLRQATSLTILVAGGKVVSGANFDVDQVCHAKIRLRFAVASDGHFGEKDTPYESYFQTLTSRINEEHTRKKFDFCVINGDIIHDDKSHFAAAKAMLDQLNVKYFVSQGNHDHVSPEEWKGIWGIPVNHEFSIGKNSFLIGTTSNEAGTYLCPDLQWMQSMLEKHRQQKNIFLFIHINPGKLTKYGIECPDFFNLLAKYKNVRAVFNGHDHDEDGVKMKQDIPFLFDAHFGGSWGTNYRGYRVVELAEDNSLITYLMNPGEKINESTL